MYSNVNLSINFFTRKSKVNNKRVNIYVRITVNQQRAEFSLSRSILPKNWDSKKKRAKIRTNPTIIRLKTIGQKSVIHTRQKQLEILLKKAEKYMRSILKQ